MVWDRAFEPAVVVGLVHSGGLVNVPHFALVPLHEISDRARPLRHGRDADRGPLSIDLGCDDLSILPEREPLFECQKRRTACLQELEYLYRAMALRGRDHDERSGLVQEKALE